jgi:hypothetical protein
MDQMGSSLATLFCALTILGAALWITYFLSRSWQRKDKEKLALTLTPAPYEAFNWTHLNEERKYIEVIGNTRLQFLLVFVGVIGATMAADVGRSLKVIILVFATYAAIVLAFAVNRAFERAHSLRSRIVRVQPTLGTGGENPFTASDDEVFLKEISFHRITSRLLPGAGWVALLIVLIIQSLSADRTPDEDGAKVRDIKDLSLGMVEQLKAANDKVDFLEKRLEASEKNIHIIFVDQAGIKQNLLQSGSGR